MLNAEWSYLNQPTRIEQLARRYLTPGPHQQAQLGGIDALPLRPCPTPRPPRARGTSTTNAAASRARRSAAPP